MKRRILFAILVLSALLLPSVCFADTYEVNEQELSVTFPEDGWAVFTRDNLKDNQELAKLGTDEKTMRSSMEKAYAHLIAVRGGAKNRSELLIRATENPYINNMNTLTESEMKALLEGVNENYASELDDYESEIAELGENRFIRMRGRYDKDGYDVVQYLTFINGNNYLMSVQKVIDFTEKDIEEIDDIIGSIQFQINPEKSENDVEAYVKAKQDTLKSSQKPMSVKILMTAAVVLVIIFLLWFKNRRRRFR